MAMTNEQYEARIAYLRSRAADVLFPSEVYDRIVMVIDGMIRYADDIETAMFADLDEDRVVEVSAVLSKAVQTGDGWKASISLLDMFDLERISLLAEFDPQSFGIPWTREEMAALTSALERLRLQAFPSEPGRET